VEESRDVVESSAPLLESSQPILGEEEGQIENGDQGGKGGSSFEELDMELEEEKEEKTNEAEEEDHNGQQKPMMVGETIGNRE
ncbi:hypothetical protein M9458_014161, partial [Cirrhinus mrigala]